MKKISGKVINFKGVATSNLQPDLSRINAEIEPKFGLTVVSGTFNVQLDEEQIFYTEDQLDFARSETRTLTFQKCRVKKDENKKGVRSLLMRASVHKNNPEFANILEIMSDRHLCDFYGVKSPDPIIVEVNGDETWWLQESDEK